MVENSWRVFLKTGMHIKFGSRRYEQLLVLMIMYDITQGLAQVATDGINEKSPMSLYDSSK